MKKGLLIGLAIAVMVAIIAGGTFVVIGAEHGASDTQEVVGSAAEAVDYGQAARAKEKYRDDLHALPGCNRVGFPCVRTEITT